MARYFFHVHDGNDYPDTEGTELRDLDAVRSVAITTASQLLKESTQDFWNGEVWKMDVTDPTGHLLFTLSFSGCCAPGAMAEARSAAMVHA